MSEGLIVSIFCVEAYRTAAVNTLAFRCHMQQKLVQYVNDMT